MLGLATASPAAASGDRAFMALSGTDAAAFRLPGDVELVRGMRLAPYELTYARYQQVYGDRRAKVLGGQLTVYRDDSGTPRIVLGNHYSRIRAAEPVGISNADAQRIAAQDVGSGQRGADLSIDPVTGRYLYRVETQRLDSRWFHLIDAHSGRIVSRYDGLAHGCAVSTDASCGFGVAYDDGDLLDVKDLDGLTTPAGGGHELRSGDSRQETHDQGSSKKPFVGPIATDADDLWIAPGDKSPAQPALVDAQYYAKITDDYYSSEHGFDWVQAGGKTMKLIAHYGSNYSNAFWNGTYAVFGDGDQSLYREFTPLDVVGHELSHGVTEFTSDLAYQNESGALNESFSDVMGNSMEPFAEFSSPNREPGATLSPDWLVAEDLDLRSLADEPAQGFRNMQDPEEDDDPDHYSERYTGNQDNGGVHTNSGIPNHAYYLLVAGGFNAGCDATGTVHDHCTDSTDTQDNGLSVTGIGVEDAQRIFFLGFTGLPSNADMCDARHATEAVANALYPPSGTPSQQLASTTDAWVAVGLTDAVCGATAPGKPVHVGDLDGAAGAVSGRYWDITVSVTVHDLSHAGVADATVSFSASGTTLGTYTCTPTNSSGACTFNATGKSRRATFRVADVTGTGLFYQPGLNHDSDGDSDGSSITVTKP